MDPRNAASRVFPPPVASPRTSLALQLGLALVLFTLVVAGSRTLPGGLSVSTPSHPTTLAPSQVSGMPLSPSAAPAPYHLRWISPPQAVLGLSNGYRDSVGNLMTQGTAAYTCYMNYSNGAGGNLYLLTNQSGPWTATQIGTPLTAGTSNGGPGCWVTTGSWNGKLVSFIAYLSTGDDSLWNDLSNGVSVIYDPTGNLNGPWVNVVAEPPGFHNPGGCCVSPASLSAAVANNATLLITFSGGPPLWSLNAAASVLWVVGIPLSALPTTPGGTASAPWQVSIPDANDICCGEPANAPAVNAHLPQILTGASGVDLAFVRADTTPGGFPQVDIAQYTGTVLSNGNTTWSSSVGGGVPDLEATFESVVATPNVGGGLPALMLGDGTTFLGVQNASSLGITGGANGFSALTTVWGKASSWQNTTLNEINPGSAVYDTTGATYGPCGVTFGDEALFDPSASTAQPAVSTYNVTTHAWNYQPIGPVNASNELPNFLVVSAQGQYVDAMFENQPGGGASGWTTFYTAQAVCTNSTLNSVSVSAAPSATIDFNQSALLTAHAQDMSGAALYPSNGVVYQWAIRPSSLATLNVTSGPLVNLTALAMAGTVTVYANASQYGWISHTTFTVTIVKPSPPSSSGSGGSSPPYLLAGIVVVAVAGVGGYMGYRMIKGRRPPSSTPAAPTPASAPPPTSAPPPPPPPPPAA